MRKDIYRHTNRPIVQQISKDSQALLVNLSEGENESIMRPISFGDIDDYAMNIHVFCIKCRKIISSYTKIKQEKKYYCVGCFAKMEQYANQFQVISTLKFPIFDTNWPAAHELLLLESLQRFGFGNWRQIQEFMNYMGAKYTICSLQSHYNKCYGSSEKTLAQISQQLLKEERNNLTCKAAVSEPRNDRKEKETCYGESSQLITVKDAIAGYNPRRQQFLIEYNENLEKHVADLQFSEHDSPDEIELKMQILETYNQAVKERNEKHDLIIEHRLLDTHYQEQKTKRNQSDQCWMQASNLTDSFLRYLTHEQHVKLEQSIYYALKIQAMIKAMQKIRKQKLCSSITTVNQIFKCSPKRQGQPRKKVHLDPSCNNRTSSSKSAIDQVGLTKEEVLELLEEWEKHKGHTEQLQSEQAVSEQSCSRVSEDYQQSQLFSYKGIKIKHIKFPSTSI